MLTPQDLLTRLDAIGASLSRVPEALALLGLGSVGKETERLDTYSDLDFFVIVQPGSKQRFLDNLDWLSGVQPIAYAFRNTSDGYKLLFQDGIFCEYAIFEPQDLKTLSFAEGRLVWQRPEFDPTLVNPAPRPTQEEKPTEWLVGEALTNLFVGMGRYRRGEKLTALLFTQTYISYYIVQLAPRIEPTQPGLSDPFSGDRRFEQRYPQTAARLSAMMQGYDRIPESARAALAFFEQHFEVNPAIRSAILRLIDNMPD